MEMYLELWVWLGALLLFVVIELFTVGLISIFFAVMRIEINKNKNRERRERNK